jgi:uncharacterized protein (DUF1697 family)
MPVVICMLRGVNVGGHNKIKMDALRALCESLKLRDPQTFIQSGNVIFITDERDLTRLAKRIQDAIDKKFGFRPGVILRTATELRVITTRNPFARRRDIEFGKLLVTFLANEPAAEARETVRKMKTDPEELHLIGREIFIYFPLGAGKSKLPWSSLDKKLNTSGTARNWNSVTKLLEIADSLESAK